MQTIFKYTLEITDRQVMSMPAGAKPLTVQMQNGKLQLWVLCDPGRSKNIRTFAVYGTGNPISDSDYAGEYIASVQDGSFIWHVFAL